jgi:hypothetical protein
MLDITWHRESIHESGSVEFIPFYVFFEKNSLGLKINSGLNLLLYCCYFRLIVTEWREFWTEQHDQPSACVRPAHLTWAAAPGHRLADVGRKRTSAFLIIWYLGKVSRVCSALRPPLFVTASARCKVWSSEMSWKVSLGRICWINWALGHLVSINLKN